MARSRTVLKKILMLLNKRPMTRGELVRKTGKNRKVVGQNLKIALQEDLVYQDVLERYHLTMLGKTAFRNYVERKNDKTSWQIQSTIMVENARKIEELDNQTANNVRYKLELPKNATALKSSLAHIVDIMLETIGKEKGLGLIL
jgi:hypothetical protein